MLEGGRASPPSLSGPGLKGGEALFGGAPLRPFRVRGVVPAVPHAVQSLRLIKHRVRDAVPFGGRHELRSRNPPDRKSTRLNSSHLGISYAVFCLKKKQ